MKRLGSALSMFCLLAAPVTLVAGCDDFSEGRLLRHYSPALENEGTAPDGSEAIAFVSVLADFLGKIDPEGKDAGRFSETSAPFLRGWKSIEVAKRLGTDKFLELLGRNVLVAQTNGYRYTLFLEHPADEVTSFQDRNGRTIDMAPCVSYGSKIPILLPRVLFVHYTNGAFYLDLDESCAYRDGSDKQFDPGVPAADGAEPARGPRKIALLDFGLDVKFRCMLLDDIAPMTVKSFEMLARGEIPLPGASDGGAKVDDAESPDPAVAEIPEIEKIPWYRLAKGQATCGNRVLGIGIGSGRGVFFADELTTRQRHNMPGLLTTLPDYPGHWSGAIGITADEVPMLDDVGTIFGICEPRQTDLILRLFDIAGGGEYIAPLIDVKIYTEE